MIWKVKLKAFFIHFCVTVLTSGLAALCVYVFWYPGPFAQMVGGTKILYLIVLIEFFLGPVSSFVVYNPTKSFRHLLMDYGVIATFQFSALAYGVFTLAQARPIYMVFVKDRLEVVSSANLSQGDLQKVRDVNVNPGWAGPKLICVDYPTDPNVRSELLWSALAGKDIQLLPEFYRQCQDGEVLAASFPKNKMFSDTPIKLADLPVPLADKEFTWLPMVTRFGAWLVVYVRGEKEQYINLNPFTSAKSEVEG